MKNSEFNFKEIVPIRRFEWEEDKKTGRITILRPKFESAFCKKYLLPFFKNKFFKIKLDELGSIVWKNCDGKNSVEGIKAVTQKTFNQDIEKIDERLKKFILQLHREKFVILLQKKL
ncbi:MAG: PqqD family protein [Calditrichaceae bacterium]|nr:PqqD family protein [Calditrichaceae bacterium]MBN2709874.1 PqqD family protein [Calditrichaceae bacterium]RQV92630.1 MAG: PqqD family protein [Calditrichota bacterium]